MKPEEFDLIRASAAEKVTQLGAEGALAFLIELLDGQVEPSVNQEWVHQILLNLGEVSDVSRARTLVRIVLHAKSESVASRVRHWELDAISRNGSEAARNEVLSLLGQALRGEDVKEIVRASLSLVSFGERYEGLCDDLRTAYSRMGLVGEKAALLRACANFGAVTDEEIREGIDEHLRTVGFDQDIFWLVARHGAPRHAEALLNSDIGPHGVLMGLLEIIARFPDDKSLQEIGVTRFTDASPGYTVGLEHKAASLLDSSHFAEKVTDNAIRTLSEGGLGLYETNIVMSCNQREHLRFFGGRISQAPGSYSEILGPIIRASSGAQGRFESVGETRKEASLSLASRFGMPELSAWVSESIRHESSGFILERHARDCALWGFKDFGVAMSERSKVSGGLRLPSGVFESCGVAGGEATIQALLEVDGRIEEGEDPLSTYVEGLALASHNVGSTSVLTDIMNSAAVEPWKRVASAFAVRRVCDYRNSPEVDWEAVANFIGCSEHPDYVRQELLIALATHKPDLVLAVIESFRENEDSVSRLSLAKILAGLDLTPVLEGLRRYEMPAVTPYTKNFEAGYAVLCVIQLCKLRVLDEPRAIHMLENGLLYEVDAAVYVYGDVPADYVQLREVLKKEVLRSNNEWRSYAGQWDSIAEVEPVWLLSNEVVEHVENACDSATKGYLDALVAARRKLDVSEVWKVTQRLMFNRSRGVSWYAAYVGALASPKLATEWVVEFNPASDGQVRTMLDVAFWLSDDCWVAARTRAEMARRMSLLEYSTKLEGRRRLEGLAIEYWGVLVKTVLDLAEWRYVQAILSMPSERLMTTVREWNPDTLRLSVLRTWMLKELAKELAKQREELMKLGRLPGEAPIGRWSM